MRRVLVGLVVIFGGLLAAVPTNPAKATAGPSVPLLITPASGGAVNGGPGQIFTVRSTNTASSPYTATIRVMKRLGLTVRTVLTFPAAAANSGQTASGTPILPIPAGTYTWTAMATDIESGRLISSAEAAPQPFTVSTPPNTGAGEVSGGTTFDLPGLPGILQPCANTSFRVTSAVSAPTLPPTQVMASAGAVINVQGTEYVGPFNLNGLGRGACANATAGSGSLSLTALGTGPTGGTISCVLSGGFARVGSDVEVAVAGSCTINHLATGNVNFRAEVEFRPDPGQGLNSPVRHATFAGYFTVTPA